MDNSKKDILKADKVLTMSKATKLRLAAVAKNIQGKDMFPKKTALAKKTFANLKSLPI